MGGVGTVLVVAEPSDRGAVALTAVTAKRIAGPVALVHSSQLSMARWDHRVSPAGDTTTVLDVGGGCRLTDADIAAVLVRVEGASLPRFARSAPADRDYATAELRALVVSWLRSLGPRVVNRVDGMGMTGPSWSPRRWLVEAARAGLPVVPSVSATSARLVPGWRGTPYEARRPYTTIVTTTPPMGPVLSARAATCPAIVAGDRIVGAAALPHRAACLRLAAASGCRILEVHFVSSGPGAEMVAAVGPVPGLTTPAELDAIADLLAAMALGMSGVGPDGSGA